MQVRIDTNVAQSQKQGKLTQPFEGDCVDGKVSFQEVVQGSFLFTKGWKRPRKRTDDDGNIVDKPMVLRLIKVKGGDAVSVIKVIAASVVTAGPVIAAPVITMIYEEILHFKVRMNDAIVFVLGK